EVGPPFASFPTIVNGQAYPETAAPPTGAFADLASHKLIWRGVGPTATTPPLKGQGIGNAQPKPNVQPTPVCVGPNPNPGGPNLDAPGSLTNAKANKGVAHDQDVVTAADGQNHTQQFATFKDGFGEHAYIHQYISGTMGTEHVSLGD